MNEPYESSLQSRAFVPVVPSGPVIRVERPWEDSPGKLSLKRSIAACGFLVFYLAAYLGAGYAGIVIVEKIWSLLFR